ncbi:hypothetical protein [Paenibacillus sp. GbtcB18]|uniref:hypothetical protein n=1 Tax=Paenibacillus sp. GbtcB18 TaxID=2824763 RepID=UPI001C2F815A|nr:hypothetical protein [Paenibacillus sp. GbtcB18]
MATVSTSLELYDRFSQQLQRASQVAQSTAMAMERLKAVAQAQIRLNIDMSGAMSHLEQIRQRISRMGTGSAISIVINAQDVINKVAQIRQRIHRELTSTAVRILLDESRAIQQARQIGNRIRAQIGTITAQVQVSLPAALESMLSNIRRLVLQLLLAIRSMSRILPINGAQQLQDALRRIAELERKIIDLQNQLNSRVQATGTSAGGFLGQLKGILATYLSIVSAQKLLNATIGGAMEQQKMRDMLIARTGDAQIGTAMFDKFKKDALKAGMDVKDSLQATLSFFSTTQNTKQLEKLNNLTQRLNAFDSAGNGLEGAAFALKEAMSGDIVSLAERFNMSKSDIRRFKIDDLGKKGDVDGFIKAFDKLLEKQKMGQKAFETMLASPAKQAEILGNNIKSAFADAGDSALKSLLPMILQINAAFQSGQFSSFFNGLSTGLAWVMEKALQLFNAIGQIHTYISSNWSTIEPIIYGIAAAFGAWLATTIMQSMYMGALAFATGTSTAAIFAQTLAVEGLAMAWRTLNAAQKANVIMLIISIVVGLIVWLYELWKTNDAFVEGFMRAWYGLLNFFDQIPVFFVVVSNGIVNAFMAAKTATLKIMEDMVNGTIDRINKMINKLNATLGVGIDTITRVEFTTEAALEQAAVKKAGDEIAASLRASAAQKASEREANLQSMLKSRADNRALEDAANKAKNAKMPSAGDFDFTAWNKAADAARAADKMPDEIKKVKKVGKIEDKVDISSEDLKVMRDLAEMKSIQNFVTLTPTVNVSTGDINTSDDINTIVDRITQHLNEEVAASAKGVYT